MPDVQRELAKALHLAGSSPDQHMELLLALTPVVQDLMRRATAAELAEIVAEAERTTAALRAVLAYCDDLDVTFAGSSIQDQIRALASPALDPQGEEGG